MPSWRLVIAVIQRLPYGHQHKLDRVIWGHFLVWEGRWNHSVPGCQGCFGTLKSLPRNLKTCPVFFGISALGWCSSQLVCVHLGALWTLDVKLLSDGRSPISLVFCRPFWSSLAHDLLHYPTRCNFQSHHEKKVASRPKCMQIYINKRNRLQLEIKPGD